MLFSRRYTKLRRSLFFVLLLGVLALFAYMSLPFFAPIAWAAVLGSLFYPLSALLSEKTGSRNAGAMLTLGIIIVSVLVPVLFVAFALVREVIGWYEYLSDPATRAAIISFIQNIGDVGFVNSYVSSIDVAETVQRALSSVASNALAIVRKSSVTTISFIAKLFVMLYVLFFFLRDGEKILRTLMRLVPLGDDHERTLFKTFTSTARATLKGSLFLALVQGVIGGVFFAIIGLPSIIFFTVMMTFFALIPALGANIVAVPAAAYLLLTGNIWGGVVLLVGAVLINISDNILRPYFVGSDTEMHPALILLSTLGGIALFGISGVVFGPIVAALLIAFLTMYEEEFKKDIEHESGKPAVHNG